MSRELKGWDKAVDEILAEDATRADRLAADYNPVTGKGAPGERVYLHIKDFSIPEQWIPKEMSDVSLVAHVAEAGSIAAFTKTFPVETRPKVRDTEKELIRIRRKYDFAFWAYDCIHIRSKIGGLIRFKLNYAQIILLEECEKLRKEEVPIDIILVKARQWGGSTFCIFYQTWLMFKWDEFHSFTVAAHIQSASETVVQMLKDAMADYPAWDFDLPEGTSLHFGNLGKAGSTYVLKDDKGNRVLHSEIYIGSAEEPDGIRSKSVRGIHYSEVGVWPDTPKKSSEELVADISGGLTKRHLSMQVMESTAKRSDDYFHTVYLNAKNGKSSYHPLFIPWFYIPYDTLPIKEGKAEFAKWLIDHKDDDSPSGRWHSSGKHYWWLWTLGATLEGINWYRYKELDFTTYSSMANEAPSTDIEAFQAAGTHVFDPYDVDAFAKKCRPHVYEGDLISDAREGADVLKGITFIPKSGGNLKIWEMPDTAPVSDRYLVAVDIGGPNRTSDYSSVRVFDRFMMMPDYGGVPGVVAEMHYHTDHDLLAYDAARLAKWYGNALLVIESNTLETNDKERDTGGDGSQYILDILSEFYPNLYARDSAPEDIVPGAPRKWGFHTNPRTKPQIIDNMKKCLREGLWDEPSKICCEEMSMYIDDNGKFTAPPHKHDDVLMATAIGLWICYRSMALPKFIEQKSLKKKSFSANATSVI